VIWTVESRFDSPCFDLGTFGPKHKSGRGAPDHDPCESHICRNHVTWTDESRLDSPCFDFNKFGPKRKVRTWTV
jgi:hypothetical protein